MADIMNAVVRDLFASRRQTPPIVIGRAGEYGATTVTFDLRGFIDRYGTGTPSLLHKRPPDDEAYIVPPSATDTETHDWVETPDEATLVWHVGQVATSYVGNGTIELQWRLPGTTSKKTAQFDVVVLGTIGNPVSEIPDAQQIYLDVMQGIADDAEDAADRAEEAVSHYPKIVNGHWYVWDVNEGVYVDTGFSAQGGKGDHGTDGVSPTVQVTNIPGGNRVTITDKNGPKVFEVDDGISPSVLVADIDGGHRVTITGADGSKIFNVMDGAPGTDGADGHSPYVNSSGYWVFWNDSTGAWVPTNYKAAGTPGEDGHSPYIGQNGNWFAWDDNLAMYDDTGVYAGGGSADAVLYTPMSLTPAQQEQARGNIGAVWSADFDSVTSIVPSRNLFNPSEFQHGGGYISADGVVHANETYGYTGFIPVSEGDTLWWNGRSARTICAYNSEKRAVAASGSNVKVESGEYTVPSGIAFVRITFWESYVPEHPMINVGEELLDYEPYGSKRMVKLDAIPTIPKEHVSGFPFEQTESLLGSDSPTVSAATLASGTALTLTDAPYFIKKNVTVSARMEFETFTSVEVGKGQNSYRGKSVIVDGTNVTMVSYNDSGTAVSGSVVAHGLTVSDYLQVTMFMGDDGKCEVTINTTSGTFDTVFDFSAEWNYSPFVVGAQAMTDVQLGYSCSDIRCPMWIFGDSYIGLYDNRVGGQLRQLGFFNFALVGVAGGRANDGSKATYPDLQRMLALGTPKYIVWTLGMNGGDAANIAFLPTLIALCEDKGIELILYKVPHIPTIDHSTLNAYIESTGLRYIDACAAVGATTAGVWYTGMLSNDEVHPSALGSKAIAMRFLTDVPEIMQYGTSVADAPTASSSNPAMDGTASAGSSAAYARGDHVHPSDTTRLAVNQGAANAGKFMVVGNDGNITAVTMTAWQGGSY